MESKYQQRFWSFVVSCIKTALFLGLCVFMAAFLSKITLPYDVHWYISRLSIGRIAELPENSIDVAAFGGSSGMEAGNISSILIDKVEYSQNKRGFNIVVFDNESGEVIDSVNWDTYSGTLDSAVR